MYYVKFETCWKTKVWNLGDRSWNVIPFMLTSFIEKNVECCRLQNNFIKWSRYEINPCFSAQ